jgi:hypothetical protein
MTEEDRHDGDAARHDAAYGRIWTGSAEGAVIFPADPVLHSPTAIGVLVSFGVDAYHEWISSRRPLAR